MLGGRKGNARVDATSANKKKMSSTAVVTIATPVDRAYTLSKFVYGPLETTDRTRFEEEVGRCRDMVSSGEYTEFVDKILREQAVLLGAEDKDHFQYARLVNELAEALATVNGGGGDGAPTASPELRLRILASLYNLVETRGGAKLRTLQQIVRFASETRQMAKLDAFLTSVSSLPSQWALTPVESRELFLTVANALSRSGDHHRAQSFRVNYLQTFEEASAEEMADAKPVARDAALGYIRSPVLSQRSNLPSLRAVDSLRHDSELQFLHELLTIFATGRLDEYLSFQARHGAEMEAIGIDNESSLETMRLLTLASLATDRDTVHYDEIAAALQVPKEDVEEWVVRGISRGLLEGRMDEMSESVAISRATAREFGSDQWSQLAERLRKWRSHVDSMVATIESSQRHLA